MQQLITVIQNVMNTIKPVAPVLAGTVFVIIGILWMTAKDPQKKQQYQEWAIGVVIGLAIVYLAGSFVNWATAQFSGF